MSGGGPALLLPLGSSKLKSDVEAQRGANVSRMERRDSMFDKLVNTQTIKYVKSARFRALAAFALLATLVLLAGGRQVYDQACLLANRLWVKLPGSEGHPVVLPSLNLFDYERVTFPVFKDTYPEGLKREQMPQLPARPREIIVITRDFGAEDAIAAAAAAAATSTPTFLNNTNSSGLRDDDYKSRLFWTRFESIVHSNGGRLVRDEEVDLRFTRPLQREISGLIVYNVLFNSIKERMKRDPTMFRDHIVLVETPVEMVGRLGERIPAGTLFNLDGHHTNQVLKLCAKIMHPNLRRGNINMENHICGPKFGTRQTPLIVKAIHPLQAISLALEAGASSGHGMTIEKK